MGQTLSHGVYLPNEGERNCYAGLASNWQILNTAVGNIAEKAPLVHTHGNITNDGKVGTTANVPLITGTGGVVQAGSFGNQANTFCEGNDSRLSDARTPVAHTHTKSDVTDLLNSNFIPSATDTYDLGSSSYQWNNLYAKNYYYKGTAWGLDKANEWTAQNTYTVTSAVPIKITNNKDATNPSASEIKDIRFVDENAKIIGGVRHSLESGGASKMYLYSRSFSSDGSSNSTHGLLIVNNKQTGVHEVQSESNFIPSANNSYDLGSSSYQWNNLYAKKTYTDTVKAVTGILMLQSNGTNNSIAIHNGTAAADGGGFWAYGKDHPNGSSCRIQIYNTSKSRYERVDLVNSQFLPTPSGEIDLGTSTNKWKSLNGVNPGGLCLPDMSSGTGVSLSAGSNSYSPPSSGWLSINLTGAISVVCGNFCHSGTDMLSVPVVKGSTYTVTVATSGMAYLFVSQGNV